MKRTLNLNTQEVNYSGLMVYLIKNCKGVPLSEPITDGNSLLGSCRQIGQLTRYELPNLVDVEVYNYEAGRLDVTVRSLEYEMGFKVLDELKGALGVSRRPLLKTLP